MTATWIASATTLTVMRLQLTRLMGRSPCATTDAKTKVKMVAVGAGTAYLIYRCARMIPSLAPPLWWTIPGNLAIP
jgi:hypothetical protein